MGNWGFWRNVSTGWRVIDTRGRVINTLGRVMTTLGRHSCTLARVINTRRRVIDSLWRVVNTLWRVVTTLGRHSCTLGRVMITLRRHSCTLGRHSNTLAPLIELIYVSKGSERLSLQGKSWDERKIMGLIGRGEWTVRNSEVSSECKTHRPEGQFAQCSMWVGMSVSIGRTVFRGGVGRTAVRPYCGTKLVTFSAQQ
jgi:hypothetical protein